MNPDFGYQLYQTQRPMTRTQIIAGDAHRGRQAAAVTRTFRRIIRRTRTSGAVASTTASVAPRYQASQSLS